MKFLKMEKFSLTRALLEIVLIVIGITVALWLDNWNTDRLNKRKEIEILKSFDLDLVAIIARSKEAYAADSTLFESGAIILNDLKNPLIKEYRDSLDNYYATFYLYDTPEMKRSTINTLNLTGADIIQNDSLRRGLIDAFERTDETFNYFSTLFLDQFNYDIQPFLNEHVTIIKFRERARPLDYKALKNNKIALNRLNNFLQHRYSIAQSMKYQIPMFEKLRLRIQKEVDRLE